MAICFTYQQRHSILTCAACNHGSTINHTLHWVVKTARVQLQNGIINCSTMLAYVKHVVKQSCRIMILTHAKQQTEVKDIYIDAFYHPPTPLYQTASLLEYIELKSLLINSVVITVH